MRIATTLLFLSILAVPTFSQRPWIKVVAPNVGTTPMVSSTQNAVFLFDSIAATTYNQGLQWEGISGIAPSCKAILPYVNNTTLAFSQTAKGQPLYSCYTLTGITWTQSDTLDLNDKTVIKAEAVNDKVHIATREGWLYTWSATIDSANIGKSGGEIRDFVASSDVLACMTTWGLSLCTDGKVWTVVNPPSSRDGLDITTAIAGYHNTVIAATDQGVFMYNIEDTVWVPLGSWTAAVAPLNIQALAFDKTRIVAMAQTPEGRHQLYRLEATDTAWIPTGWEIPMDQASMGRQSLVLDAGWALTYQTSAIESDSNGVYAYNLNDLTGVSEAYTGMPLQIVPTGMGFELRCDCQGALAVDIVTLDGRRVFSGRINGPVTTIVLPPTANGVLSVLVTTDAGSVARTIVMR